MASVSLGRSARLLRGGTLSIRITRLHLLDSLDKWFVFARRSGLLVVFAMNYFMTKHLRCFITLALLAAISACNKMSAGTNMLAGVPLQKDLMIPLQAEMQN